MQIIASTVNDIVNIKPLWIRLGIVILSFILIIIFLKKLKDKKKNYKILIHTTIRELLLPTIILIIVLAFENIFFSAQTKIDYVEHLFYELLLIVLIYGIFIYVENKSVYRKESKKETEYFIKYIEALEKVEHKIIAFSTVDFSHFFEPLGIKYLFAQAKKINEIRNKIKKGEHEQTIITIRIIAIPDDSLYADFIANAFKNSPNLSERERNLFNIYLLHDLLSIDLYLVPKKLIMDKLNEIKTKNKIRYKKLDTLIIDNNYYRTDEKNNCLFFEEIDDEAQKDLVNGLIILITQTRHDEYHIDNIRKKVLVNI